MNAGSNNLDVTLAPSVTVNTPSIAIPVDAVSSMPAGIFMGDSMIPLPKKLVNKTIKLEFVDMHEMLPENWPDLLAGDQSKFYAAFGKKKPPPVTDILTWTECFASLVAVLSAAYPSKVPEFMAYMSMIIKCHKRFDGMGWLSYDRAFRRKAATLKNLNWAQTDSTLFSLAFTGRAKQMHSCDLCFSTNHPTSRCPDAFQLPTWGMPPPLSVANFNQQPLIPPNPHGNLYRKSANICGLFNSRKGPQSCTSYSVVAKAPKSY